MRVHIEVTQEDIDEGYPKDVAGEKGGCMVWRAFMRCTEGAFPTAIVVPTRIDLYDLPVAELWKLNGSTVRSHELGCLPLPAHVEVAISHFDRSASAPPVQPFSFDLDIPVGMPEVAAGI